MSEGWNNIDTDVLVVGGGVAGSMAAIPALEAGLKAVICEKGKVLDHCGSIGGGVDDYLTVMDPGPEWDTPEFLIKHLGSQGQIRARSRTGYGAQDQKSLKKAIKRARHLALLPFVG